jgi:hypothetical protein
MSAAALGDYLKSIKYHLRLSSSTEKDIISELSTHIDDSVEELKKGGLSEEEAQTTCLKLMGSAKRVAKQLCEAHSQGTWRQTLLAATPHLLFALLFALSWWPGIGWLLVCLTLIFGVAIYGWWQKRPNWFFSWMGYLLLPVLLAGLLLFYLPRGWAWVAIIFYIPVTAFLVYHVTVQTIRRDWLYSSLMMLPLPIVVAWFITVGSAGTSKVLNIEYIKYFGPWIGMSFLILAASVALFIRLRQRWLKIALLVISGLLTLSLVLYYAGGRLGIPAFAILAFIVMGLFITPAILEHRIRRNQA